MEKIIQLHIEKLPEGLYLATSDEVQGLIAQGRTLSETIEIARDVAKKLLEAQDVESELELVGDKFDYPLVVGV
jgi:predicted RNase H-like HicB family nuclease